MLYHQRTVLYFFTGCPSMQKAKSSNGCAIFLHWQSKHAKSLITKWLCYIYSLAVLACKKLDHQRFVPHFFTAVTNNGQQHAPWDISHNSWLLKPHSITTKAQLTYGPILLTFECFLVDVHMLLLLPFFVNGQWLGRLARDSQFFPRPLFPEVGDNDHGLLNNADCYLSERIIMACWTMKTAIYQRK